jgi:hypothetical protein
MEPDGNVRAPGAAVAVALCGHWDHEPPCPLAPHRVSAVEDGGELRVRILFAAEPDTEPEVRRLIELALSGRVEFPDGFTTPWRLRASGPSDVSAEETGQAEHLIRS